MPGPECVVKMLYKIKQHDSLHTLPWNMVDVDACVSAMEHGHLLVIVTARDRVDRHLICRGEL